MKLHFFSHISGKRFKVTLKKLNMLTVLIKHKYSISHERPRV